MSSRNKYFSALSLRQQQRRLTRIRLRDYYERRNLNETESSSDELESEYWNDRKELTVAENDIADEERDEGMIAENEKNEEIQGDEW